MADGIRNFDPENGLEHVDILIVGAGLSGINAACLIQMKCPQKSFAVLEARATTGGTWDLFRYPGVRSDSDMATLGYSFRPWLGNTMLADANAIRTYIRDTAKEQDIEKHIRLSHRVTNANWDSASALWTVDIAVGEQDTPKQMTCNFLYSCSGYYDYEQGHNPDWPDMEKFQGQIIHPQKWPEGLDYSGKRVAVIGSGATAVTLVPAMADKAAHVTMVQRTPTYIVSRPGKDSFATFFHRCLPSSIAHMLVRWKNIIFTIYVYFMAKWKPQLTKDSIKKMAREEIGEDYDVDTHFTPPYEPWDQRLCLIPDGDLFKALKSKRASIVTGEIASFTQTGLVMQSGEKIDADIIITATGLKVKLMGGMGVTVDGKKINLHDTMSYKGMMYSDVPNLASAFGYTNASWTLKCELTTKYVCRLLNLMEKRGQAYCVPRQNDPTLEKLPAVDLSAGYILRALDQLPSQGVKTPWRVHQNYIYDIAMLEHGKLDDDVMEFGMRQPVNVAAE